MAVNLNHPDYVVNAGQLGQFAETVKDYTDTKVTNLDANVTSNDGTNVQVQVIQDGGVITNVNITTDNTVNATDVNTAIATALANYGGFQVVSLNPSTGKPDVSEPSTKIIYLTKDASSQVTDPYTEWIWIAGVPDGTWEVIGETSIDLTDYATKDALQAGLDSKVDKVEGKGLSANDFTDTDKANLDANTMARHTHANKATLDKIPATDGHNYGSVMIVGSNGSIAWEDDEYEDYAFGLVVGGREYPTCQIGNQLWMAENLDWKYPGLTIGTSDPYIECADYLNGDENTYGYNGLKYGLRYVWKCVATINSLLTDGWHVPTRDDIRALVSVVGYNTGATQLKSTTMWEDDGNGDNETGYNALPSGYYYSGTEYAGKRFSIWTSTVYDPSLRYIFNIGTGPSLRQNADDYQNGLIPLSIRLVKNLT